MSLIKASEITGTSLTKLLHSVYLTNKYVFAILNLKSISINNLKLPFIIFHLVSKIWHFQQHQLPVGEDVQK